MNLDLLKAIQKCDDEFVQRAVNSGTDPNTFTTGWHPTYEVETTKSLLEYAVEAGCSNLIRWLIEQGATVENEPVEDFFVKPRLRSRRDWMFGLNTTNENPFNGNHTLFLWSLTFKRCDVSQQLFERFGSILPDDLRRLLLLEALYMTIEVGSEEMTQCVLGLGVDIAMLNPVYLPAPSEPYIGLDDASEPPDPLLTRAAIYGDISILATLLTAGADIDIRSSSGTTPLMESIFNRNEEASLFLIKQGADVEAVAWSDGATAASLARSRKQKRTLESMRLKR